MTEQLQSGNQQLIRDINVTNVLNVLRERDMVSRIGLAQILNLGKSTVTGIINALMATGAVEELGAEQSAMGRKPRSLRLNANWKYVISVRLDISQMHMGIVNLKGEIRHDTRVDRPLAGFEWNDVLGEMVPLVRQLCIDARVDWDRDVLGVAIAIPGVVNSYTGVSISRLHHGKEFPLASWLSEQLGKRVVVENDANALCLGERLKSDLTALDDMLVILVEDGIGAGIISNGMMVRGGALGAGQIGHMKVANNGKPCSCGQTGCLESVVSSHAMIENFLVGLSSHAKRQVVTRLEISLDQIDVRTIIQMATAGVAEARRVMDEVGFYIGRAITTVINVLNPTQIVLGGPIFEDAGRVMLDRVWEMVRDEAAPVLWKNLQIRILEDNAETFLLGAASQVLDEAFSLAREGLPDRSDVSLTHYVSS